jgi:hypothetical protein
MIDTIYSLPSLPCQTQQIKEWIEIGIGEIMKYYSSVRSDNEYGK